MKTAWEAFKKKVTNLYPCIEGNKKSVLKGFATQHTIKASKTFDPKTFFVWLLNKKPLKNSNHRQKVRIVLRANMENYIFQQARNQGCRIPPTKFFAPPSKNVLSIVENYWT